MESRLGEDQKPGELTPVSYWLPWPPSTNALWRSVGRRNILSAAARNWNVLAAQELSIQKPRSIPGPVIIRIKLCAPSKRKYDIDNRIKSVLDLLVRMALIEGDGCDIVKSLLVLQGGHKPGAHVTIYPASTSSFAAVNEAA